MTGPITAMKRPCQKPMDSNPGIRQQQSAYQHRSQSMTNRISILISMLLPFALGGFSSLTLASEATASAPKTVAGDVPGLDRIRADAGRHFVYTHEGLPMIRDLASSPRVNGAAINSSVRNGSLLTLNVSFFLDDLNSGGESSSLVSGRMTYQETDGVWELQTSELSSVEGEAALSQVDEDDC
jgi:hypothetical protein